MLGKRNTILMITLVFLVCASVGLTLFSGRSGPEIDRTIFRISDTERIDEVTLQSPRGDVRLKYVNGRWRLNDRWDADMQMIKVLFATLKQVETRRPVSSVLLDTVMRQLKERGTTIKLSSGGNTSMLFQVCGNEAKTETWFLKPGENKPYVVTIPGYHVYVGGIFDLDVNGWRNKRVFDFNWRNFRSLKVTYSERPSEGFEIEMQGKYFGVKNLTVSDTTKVNDYLDAVSLLFAERYVPSESHGSEQVMAKILITDSAGKTYSLDLFFWTEKNEYIYGRITSGDILAFRIDDVRDLLKKRDYFLFQPR